MAVFETSFGRTLKFCEDQFRFNSNIVGLRFHYADYFKYNSLNVQGTDGKLNYSAVNTIKSKSSLSLAGYVTRIVPTFQFIQLMQNTRFPLRFKRALDIGCGKGIHLALLKSFGIAGETVGIDILPNLGFDHRSLRRLHNRFRKLKLVEGLQDSYSNIPQEKRTNFQRLVLECLTTPKTYGEFYGHRPSKSIFDLKQTETPHLDRYISGNVFDLEEKFDLITSFASLDWFNIRTILKKISELLEEGGIFYLWVPNWWCAINTTMLFGHFPYTAQRLTKDDYFRYVDQHFKENSESLKTIYNYFDPNHPTFNDYVTIANENQLVALSYEHNIRPDPYKRNCGITPLGYAEESEEELQDVLADIHQFRPDVQRADLFPLTYAILFRKVSNRDRMSAERLKQINSEMDASKKLRDNQTLGFKIFRNMFYR